MTVAIRGSIISPRSFRFFGSGFLAGQDPGLLTVAGAPAARKIQIRDKATHKLVDQVTSGADGSWRVEYLNMDRKYYVIAFDHELQFNAVIRDNITPALMA